MKYNKLIRDKIPETIEELKQCIKEYLIHYNNHRLHMGIDLITPAQKLALQTA